MNSQPTYVFDTFLRHLDINAEFSVLHHSDAGDPFEVRIRRAIVLVFGLVVSFASGTIWCLFWALGFCIIDLVYVRYLLATSLPVSPRRFRTSVILNLFLAVWAGVFPLLLIVAFGQQFVFVASCFVVVCVLHSIARNSAFGVSTTIGLGTVFLETITITIFEAYIAETVWNQIAILSAGTLALMFFVVSFRQIIRDRTRFVEALETDAQTEKMKSLGQLTSGIAHDFNNLLTVIGGNIELARLEENGSDRDKYMENAMMASGKAGSLVSQLLAYSRKSKLRAEHLYLDRVIIDLENGLFRVLPANVELDTSLAKDPIQISADQVMLESALLNLVINARDAIGPLPGTIWVSSTVWPKSGFVEICVEDSGPGMSSDQMSKAVEPFFTTKGIGEGSGLGLSMVSGFSEQSGGRFELTNRPGGGLRAAIFLPLIKTEK